MGAPQTIVRATELQCSTCWEFKPDDQFGVQRRNARRRGRASSCRACGKRRDAERRRASGMKKRAPSVTPTHLRCSTCREWKPDNDFSPHRGSRNESRRFRQHSCKACYSERARERRRARGAQSRIESRKKIARDGELFCTLCKVWLPDDEFSKCRSNTARRGRQANCRSCSAAAHMLRTYGLTLEDYDELLAQQGGGCAICGTTDVSKELGGRLVVDHCHTSGAVRGLLCSPCNKGIGHLDDDPERVFNAALYLAGAA